ncbi:hypothetical protein [Goodfellowiella coeruleoviolacea]|uniref:Uncharacterized protein n=1 Tax=Goodfellowiella coeruleoviolacea TaxID=334858 RepID=A0AAE3GJB1_9PSEU|nr:hypothetical protein [Goodfellowiella coeruleoviolacea]MCP2169276.1 hypothetical protein [Goodfellowiella coeruleoviolacea]
MVTAAFALGVLLGHLAVARIVYIGLDRLLDWWQARRPRVSAPSSRQAGTSSALPAWPRKPTEYIFSTSRDRLGARA